MPPLLALKEKSRDILSQVSLTSGCGPSNLDLA